MSAAGLGDDATVESSSSKPGRRWLHKPKAWKQRSVGRLVQGPSHLFVPDQVKVRVAQVLARSRAPDLRLPRRRLQVVRGLVAVASSKRATPVSSPPSSIQASPSASKVLKDDRPPELIDLTSDVEMSSSSEDSSSATSRAEKGTRDPVPSPTGGKTVPGAPAP
ncbi:hypothetical protein GQ600_3658 [Phytophthora cactorum]|nr:hypothetical protein GQ600_3658 [Phytophthora cactorum]